MVCTVRRGCAGRVAAVAFACMLGCAGTLSAADAILYRIFLVDGGTAVSYGDFARVAGTVVFSMPLGDLAPGSPRLQLVSLPESAVDWSRTEAYAQAARARQFAEGRGEAEFSRLSEDVARTLNQIAFTGDPTIQLAAAEKARRQLGAWPSQNYWYRATDVAELTTLLDGVLSELRVAAGQSRFDLSLVATTMAPPVVMLPAPGLRESIEQAFALTRVSSDAAERASLLRGITDALAGPAGEGGWAAALRARATADLLASTRTDTAYAALSSRALEAAAQQVRRGDVKGMETVIRGVLEGDDKLGRQRPQEIAALLATLDLRLASTRESRLVGDQWTVRAGVARAYNRRARPTLDVLWRSRSSLELIRKLAGPSPRALRQLSSRAATAERELSLIKPPPELQAVHGLIAAALQLSVRAADTRTSAIAGNDMPMAWQASSAAAGALLLYDRVREEMRRLTRSAPR